MVSSILFNRIACGGSMGALIEAEGNGVTGIAKRHAEKICTSNPVVYQLVRVGVDGRLLPATDDELMEVEHLLEDDGTQLQPVKVRRQSEWLLLKTSNLEVMGGLSQHVGIEDDSQMLNARLEYTAPMLQDIKQDKILQLKCESGSHYSKHGVFDDKSSDHPNHSESCDDNVKPGKTPVETVASTTCLSGSGCSQLESAEIVLETANDVVSRSSISETHASSEPGFSILKGEICLNNLTMRELQEVFRATFGRQTSVKDKLWLKRRITMGLTNSCEVPTTGIVIKDNKVVQEKVKAEPCSGQQVISGAGFLPANLISGSLNENIGDSPNSPTDQTKDEQAVPGKRVRKPLLEYDMKNKDIQMEQCATKRTRKPTKRYIEELSDVENRECTGRLVSSVKDSGHHRVFPKPQIKPVRDIGSQGTTSVTRKDSIGGCGIQIPYVSRMRRGRPRKDYYTLMNFGGTESDKTETEISYSEEEQDLDHEKVNLMVDTSSDNNGAVRADKARTSKVGVKRKHHQAWTLCEVLKLVEGVARYGAGRWSEIRRVAFSSYSHRTSVDLKDKWRNLVKASFAQDPSDKGAKNFRKPTSVSIPTSILLRVRELAEMHSQAGIECGPSKFAGQGGRIVQEKGSGFL